MDRYIPPQESDSFRATDSFVAAMDPKAEQATDGKASATGGEAAGAPVEQGPVAPSKPSLRDRAAAATAWGQGRYSQLERMRPEHASIESGFRWIVRDKDIAGGVLGGGLAYRFFFWLLALSVLTSGGLGLASRAGTSFEDAAAEAGLTASVSESVASAAQQSESGRWWLLVVGAFLTLWFSWGLLRALRLVHAAAWRITAPPPRNVPLAVGVVIASPVVLLALTSGAGWVRANVGFFPGLLATLAVAVGFGLFWLRVSMRLPSPPGLPWTAFLPGALLLGVGVEALHIFTVYFLADKLASASNLYGALGLASTLLFYLFLIGRGVVWAAELNAVVWEVRHPPADSDNPLSPEIHNEA
jgi:uncharacterized BrkB/YihY/UPF0761 family membrane protein